MAIIHIVLFEWKPTIHLQQVEEACERMLALREKCIHPSTQKPYIKMSTGGRNNSPEGRASPYTHGFVVEFESDKDRDYYLNKDPAHLAFVESILPILQNNKVLDFVPEVF
ncbi:hypothetical protein BDV96DRAFT_494718 [Lophiotrema nucula]|uniref:Stress-response A/B barrel domain-containing protein n=1 Tax=Lophiotrema nucula TaxID=690887 RepID=A0A6A5Z6I6_9PLEO|nr:hypothetical protein BDV96DRAFT_494718 [Lophiotrema nucula]